MRRAVLFDFMGVVGYSRMAVAGDPGSEPYRVLMFDGVVTAIRAARAGGLRTALVSNNDRERFEATAPEVVAQFDDLFDVVVYSSDAGVAKPHPAIYERVLTLLDVDAGDAFYFDDLARNVDSAIALGMAGVVVVNPEGQVPAVVDVLLAGD